MTTHRSIVWESWKLENLIAKCRSRALPIQTNAYKQHYFKTRGTPLHFENDIPKQAFIPDNDKKHNASKRAWCHHAVVNASPIVFLSGAYTQRSVGSITMHVQDCDNLAIWQSGIGWLLTSCGQCAGPGTPFTTCWKANQSMNQPINQSNMPSQSIHTGQRQEVQCKQTQLM